MALEELPPRFWRKVIKAPPNQCWTWTGTKNAQGYGTFRFNGAMERAHRVAANAPHGSVVRHRCDNPSCVNPAHLQVGDQKANVADCIAKGRRAPSYGESNNFSKLTDELVRELRARFAAIPITKSGRKAYGAAQKLADEFRITDTTLYHIVTRKTWRHL